MPWQGTRRYSRYTYTSHRRCTGRSATERKREERICPAWIAVGYSRIHKLCSLFLQMKMKNGMQIRHFLVNWQRDILIEKKVSSWCANPKEAMYLAAASANMQSERIGAQLLRDAIKGLHDRTRAAKKQTCTQKCERQTTYKSESAFLK